MLLSSNLLLLIYSRVLYQIIFTISLLWLALSSLFIYVMN